MSNGIDQSLSTDFFLVQVQELSLFELCSNSDHLFLFLSSHLSTLILRQGYMCYWRYSMIQFLFSFVAALLLLLFVLCSSFSCCSAQF